MISASFVFLFQLQCPTAPIIGRSPRPKLLERNPALELFEPVLNDGYARRRLVLGGIAALPEQQKPPVIQRHVVTAAPPKGFLVR